MKYAIISDIHANLEALQTVVEDARSQVDTFVCLGDIVGYNASPAECLSLVQELCEVIIVGNHDQATAGTRTYDDFNSYAQEAINWTKEQLTPTDIDFLKNLELTEVFGKHYLAAHGSPRHTDEYLLHPQRIQQNFAYLIKNMPRIHCCFVGHTHVPMIWQCSEEGVISPVEKIGSDTVYLDPSRRYIINPGSVGQPRHGDPASSYLILDDDSLTATFRAISYDIGATQDKIYDAMLPIPLAERLEIGR